MRRVLAVVGAVAMVAGALFVRGRLDDKKVEASQGPYRLVCSADLGKVCDDLQAAYAGRIEMTIEPAGATADRLRSVVGDPGIDGWLVADPWPAIVDEARRSASLPAVFAAGAAPVARSPLVLVAWKDRAGALSGPAKCLNGQLEWNCLGETAGRPWPGHPEWVEVKIGHADPANDGTGLLVLGQATAAWFDTADLSSADLDMDPFPRRFPGLEGQANRSAGSPLNAMLTVGRAAYDAVGTTEADAAQVNTAAKRDELITIYPAPMVTADVVLAVTPGDRGKSLRALVSDRARQMFTNAGWKAPDDPTLPPGNGLPSPGLLDALRSKAREVRR